MVISFLLADWVEQLNQEWQQDVEIQKLIKENQANLVSHSKFSWEHGLNKNKRKILHLSKSSKPSFTTCRYWDNFLVAKTG